MNQKFINDWVKPSIVTIVWGLLLIPVGAWLTNVPIHSIVTVAGIKNLWFAPVSAWITFTVLIICVCIAALYRRSVLALRAENQRVAKLAAETEALNSNQPKIHGVWNQAQAFWHLGRHGDEPSMQIGGWIDLTSSNTKDNIFLLAAYIDGRRSQIFIDVEVRPNVVNHQMVMLFFHPPLSTEVNNAFEATVVVEDQFNRKYELPRQSFRATPGSTPPTVASTTSSAPKPQLHFPWRVSGWCRILHEGKSVIRISGDGPLHLDGITEKVMFTGVRVEGAEVVGVFENFELYPQQTVSRGINIDFTGISLKDKEILTAKLTFVDLRGNEYPLKEATFKPLAEPESVGGAPWI